MVVFADKSKETELIEIWQQSFGDSEEYIRMFLDWNASRTMIIVYEIDGKAVSVAYLLPITYIEPGQAEIPCWYLYAAATLPEYRGCGYFGEIMKVVRENIPEPVILVPGEKSLVEYYEKQGMHIWLQGNTLEVTYDAEKVPVNCLAADVGAAEYIVKRYNALSDCCYMKWDEHFMKYICHENMICGGTQKEIIIDDKKYIAMYRIDGRQLNVLEILPQTDIEACMQVLMLETGCKKATLCMKPTVMATEELKIATNKGYFNLTMG